MSIQCRRAVLHVNSFPNTTNRSDGVLNGLLGFHLKRDPISSYLISICFTDVMDDAYHRDLGLLRDYINHNFYVFVGMST